MFDLAVNLEGSGIVHLRSLGSPFRAKAAALLMHPLYRPLDVTNTCTPTFYSIDMLGEEFCCNGGIAENSRIGILGDILAVFRERMRQ